MASALRLEARQVIRFSIPLAAATAVSAFELFAAHAQLIEWFEVGNAGILRKHHGEELGVLLVLGDLVKGAVVHANQVS